MLLLRRPASASFRRPLLPTQPHQVQCNTPPWSIIRFRSIRETSWPAAHPEKKELQKIKKALHAKNNPNAEPLKSVQHAAAAGDVPEPTKHQLYVVALHQAIPFVGFGIMDNAILLLAGEAIDIYLGVALGISTMCAAAIGNIVSDLAGVMLGTVIEDALLRWSKRIEKITNGRVKLPPMPNLTYAQRNLRSVKLSGQMGCAVGLTIGCVIGMFPLLFFPDDDSSKEKESEDGESASKKLIIEQNEQLKKEVNQWKENFRTLEREKNSGLWDKGY